MLHIWSGSNWLAEFAEILVAIDDDVCAAFLFQTTLNNVEVSCEYVQMLKSNIEVSTSSVSMSNKCLGEEFEFVMSCPWPHCDIHITNIAETMTAMFALVQTRSNISRGSVLTCLRCGGISNHHCVATLVLQV